MIPLVGVFEGDFVAQLFVVENGDPMTAVAEKLAVHAVNLRVMPENRPLEVVKDDRPLPDSMTVQDAGLQPMDVVRVRYR